LINSTRPFELRWSTWATLALCTLLPGCPLTDNYFIQGASAGAGQLVTSGGGSELSVAGTSATAGSRPDAGGDAQCGEPSGGNGSSSSSSSDAGSGSTDAGSTDDAGSSTDDAGSAGAGAGASAGGAGGTAGTAGTGGDALTGAGSAGMSSNLPQPACKDGVTKGSPCSAASAQSCYKSCGPDNVGYKRETCVNGAYDELQSGCTFPPGQDYTCYKVPPSLPGACPSGIPRGGSACQVVECTVCFGGSVQAPQYQDSTGAQKPGYCVCSEAGVWTCGSIGSWPCPGQGCQ